TCAFQRCLFLLLFRSGGRHFQYVKCSPRSARGPFEIRVLAEVLFYQGARCGTGFTGKINWQQIYDDFALQLHERTSSKASLTCINFSLARWTLTFTVVSGICNAWAISS